MQRFNMHMFEPQGTQQFVPTVFDFVLYLPLVAMLVVSFHIQFFRCFFKAVTIFLEQVHSIMFFHKSCAFF